MNISKKIIACAVVCVTLGVGGTAYATSIATKAAKVTSSMSDESVVASIEDVKADDVLIVEDEILPKAQIVEESTFAATEGTPKVEAETCSSRFNIPSEGDEICGEYFMHTYSNGQQARIPFDSEIERSYSNIPTRPIDVDALKELGSDEPLMNETSYEVVEFLDGTKRYFKLGEAPLAFTDPLRYGIYTYIEGGSGAYYSEVLPNGMTICGWR